MTDDDDDARLCRCQNCGWTGRVDELRSEYPDIPDLPERIAPDEPVPIGECPACEGALCHLTGWPGRAPPPAAGVHGLKDDINDLYQAGAKFVVITDAAIHGHGDTPDAAWLDAIENCGEDKPWHVLYDAQCFDAAPGGAMVNDFHTRPVP